MTPILLIVRGGTGMPGLEPELRWAWLTTTLSLLVAAGYVVIAFNRHFQSMLARRRDARAALGRLSAIVACCAVFGVWFYTSDMAWPAWRAYDVVLAGLACHTWWFAVRMRGLSLLDERLARADELERTAQRYRDIAELLPHVVWTATAEGLVDFCNRRWSDYAGPGRTWLDVVHPDEREAVLAWWDEVVRGRQPASREARLGCSVGAGYRAFVVSASPIVNGGAVKWLGACADVEDQKRLAAEKEVQARQKTFFLNSLSHDLRAPLNNVVLNAHLLKMSAADPAQLENANVIVENAIAAGELVTKLLECARSDGDDRGVVEVVPLAPMLNQVARRFRRISEQKGLFLKVACAEDLRVRTDRQKLERVLSNLVDNAVKFTDRGGVTLELSARGGGAGAGASVRVRDTGIGVPERDAAMLFDEFYQVDNHERDRRKGFGMGLAICRKLARQLGGDVRLERTGPGGSCFEVVVRDAARDAAGRGADDAAGADEGEGTDDGPRGGGRPLGQAGDHADPQGAGLCGV